MKTFFLGAKKPIWLERLDAELFLSYRELRGYRKKITPQRPWAIDSGGYTELSTHGKWTLEPEPYAAEVARLGAHLGKLAWAAIQDWMCEPWILENTGKTIPDHQELTCESYARLLELAPDQPWTPVLQGWDYDSYFSHLELYERWGLDLKAAPVVGIGSVCRREDTTLAEELMTELARRGLRVHGFGFKLGGLRRVHTVIESADSMAWSKQARMNAIQLPGCTHKTCANCELFAMRWRKRVLESLRSGEQQLLLFG